MSQDFDWIQVQGESMWPLLRSGEWVGVNWCARGERPAIRSGDLVLGRHSDQVWLVHRLVDLRSSGEGKREGEFVLKGDASIMTELLGADQIWGKVVAIRKQGEGGRAHRLRTSWLDQFIARLSRLRLRRTVILLGFLRRSVLK